MSEEPAHHHRSQFTRHHKPYKGKSKGAAARKYRGRIIQGSRAAPSSNVKAMFTERNKGFGRKERMARNKQIQQNKRDQFAARKRKIGGDKGVPVIVGIIALSPLANLHQIQAGIESQCVERTFPDPTSLLYGGRMKQLRTVNDQKPHNIQTYICPRDPIAVLDIAKVASKLILVVTPDADGHEAEIDALGFHFVDLIKSQGLPTTYAIHQGVTPGSSWNNLTGSTKRQTAIRKDIEGYFKTNLPATKTFAMNTEQECGQIVRLLCHAKNNPIGWTQERQSMMVESAYATVGATDTPLPLGQFVANNQVSPQNNRLILTGYLRGDTHLNTSNLVHLTGHGDYQISKIEECVVERPRTSKKLSKKEKQQQQQVGEEAKTQPATIVRRVVHEVKQGDKVPSLAELIPIDDMAHEQSLIVDDELDAAEDAASRPKNWRKQAEKPGTVSAFQAAWEDLSDSEDDAKAKTTSGNGMDLDDNEDSEDDHKGGKNDFGNTYYDKQIAGLDAKMDSMDYTMDADIGQPEGLKASDLQNKPRSELTLEEKIALFEENEEFCDQVENEDDPSKTAEVRFGRYRGLKSFRNTYWNPKQQLPLEYSQVMQFDNFPLFQKRTLENNRLEYHATMDMDDDNESLQASQHKVHGHKIHRFTIYVENVPASVVTAIAQSTAPLLLWQLFEVERKVSVLHTRVRRERSYTAPIKGKDELMCQMAFRRTKTRPIFSEDVTNTSKCLVHRYFKQKTWTIASFYGHATFMPATCLFFAPRLDPTDHFDPLVATGSLIEINCDRLLIKRAVLTGVPIEVHQKAVVVKHMFYNPDDIRHFKAFELRTKAGHTGNIREARGTKGDMKCVFNAILDQGDSIHMNLYKRQFPKWEKGRYSI